MAAMPTSDRQKDYQTEIAQLNPEQRAAVETIEGPVMVLAGPGTGKTQILSLRIAEILTKTDIGPKNILALTFTDSAAAEMRSRLVRLTGPEAGNSVAVYTFHGLANAIITESGINFYPTRQLTQVDDLARFELILDAIDRADSPAIRPPGQPDKYATEAARLISTLKREGISPLDLRRLTDTAIADLKANDSNYFRGKLKKPIEDAIARYDRTYGLADVYERYQRELATRGWYDYDDMILFVIRAFKENEALKQQYQEQYQYILVDEYQDTNNAQNELIRLLTDFHAAPNLFVVGDDKQSIYRFQGASVANLLQFLDWYPMAQVISLKQNYRSYQRLLDAAGELISHNHHQLINDPRLNVQSSALSAASNAVADVAVQAYGTLDAETLGIAEQIQTLLHRGTKPEQIAVLYRRNRDAERFIDLFRRLGIPFIEGARDDILNDRDIGRLRVTLEAASHPTKNDQAVFFFLHLDVNQVPTEDLLALARARTTEHRPYYELLAPESLARLTLTAPETLVDCRQRLDAWYKLQFNASLGQTVETILNQSGLMAEIVTDDDQLDRLERLRTFFSSVRELSALTPRATLTTLVEKLRLRENYHLPLAAGGSNAERISAIQLVTAHKSKGREFDIVFLTGATRSVWGGQIRPAQIVLPTGIVQHEDGRDEVLEEERRLFFVAMTRARRRLIISFAKASEQGALEPAPFIAELAETTTNETPTTKSLSVSAFFRPTMTAGTDDVAHAVLDEMLKTYPLSPTTLNTYLQCPQLFLYEDIYRVPAVRTGSQAYGEAVHRALEMIGRGLKLHGAIPSWADVWAVFHEQLASETLGDAEKMKAWTDRGQTILKRYYDEEVPKWPVPIDVEYNFRPHGVTLDGVTPITGKLDKIELIPGTNQVRVIDYKTANHKSANAIRGLTKGSDRDYWHQVIFYKVLADADPNFPYTVGEVALVFIGADGKFTTERFTPTDAEVEEVRQLIRDVRTRILDHDFVHTSHKKRGFDETGPNLCDRILALTSPTESSVVVTEPATAPEA